MFSFRLRIEFVWKCRRALDATKEEVPDWKWFGFRAGKSMTKECISRQKRMPSTSTRQRESSRGRWAGPRARRRLSNRKLRFCLAGMRSSRDFPTLLAQSSNSPVRVNDYRLLEIAFIHEINNNTSQTLIAPVQIGINTRLARTSMLNQPVFAVSLICILWRSFHYQLSSVRIFLIFCWNSIRFSRRDPMVSNMFVKYGPHG